MLGLGLKQLQKIIEVVYYGIEIYNGGYIENER